MRLFTLFAALVLPLAACAQPSIPSPPAPAAVSSAPASSPAEEAVRATIAQDGVHVVHFWAPWCDNSINELRAGLYEVIEAHPEVTFTFVTIWNDGERGDDMLARYAIPERVERLVVDGPRPPAGQRGSMFLGLPVSWIPTTWVFNRGGQLATAFNHGEVSHAQLTAAIESAGRTW